ncbi:MAG: GAF domain-containing protein [Ignavibacteriaceae bacterium]|nr:GAF domain-containing protein [Ignavibacteriaceae bacterium]
MVNGKVEGYTHLDSIIDSVLDESDHPLSILSNFTALIKEYIPNISWAGFYILSGDELYLGPFQGKVACTKIKLGAGVCGKSAELKQSLIVPDVHKFDGHIACDSGSNSEIVVPLFLDDKLYGVIDLDSYEFNNFDETDKIFLEKFSIILIKKAFQRM